MYFSFLPIAFKPLLYFRVFFLFYHSFYFSKFGSPTTWLPWYFSYASYDVGASAVLTYLGLSFHSDWNLFHKTFKIKNEAEALSAHSNPTWTYFFKNIGTPYSFLIWCNNLLSFFMHVTLISCMNGKDGWFIRRALFILLSRLGFEIDRFLKKYNISGHSYENTFLVAASLKVFFLKKYRQQRS